MIPKLSILTATYHAPQLLERAIASMLRQTEHCWEMIISPDDGLSYHHLCSIDHRIRIVDTAQSQTGAGCARNRALAIAQGEYIGVLDDDDTLAPNFVAMVLANLHQIDAITVPTTYLSETGQLIREIGTNCDYIDIASFSQLLGSMHVIGKKSIYAQWYHCFAQDVLHTCQMIDQLGGTIPVVQTTRYFNSVRVNSTCAQRKDIDQTYTAIIEQFTLANFSVFAKQATHNLFKFRRQINQLYEKHNPQNLEYHDFVMSLNNHGI